MKWYEAAEFKMSHNLSFLAENLSRRVNNFFTPLIPERVHCVAKPRADGKNWLFRTGKN